MSDDKNSERKAHSVIVDFFVIFKKFEIISITAVMSSVFLIISIFFIIDNGRIPGGWQLNLEDLIIQTAFGVMLGCALMVMFSLSWIAYWVFTKGRKTHRNILEIHSSFIHRSYVTTFELVRPTGETKIDKLFNHLSLVFPEVERVKKKLDNKNKKFSEFRTVKWPIYKNYDKVFLTDTGIFIIKIFEKTVTFDDIKGIIKYLNIQQKFQSSAANHIMRVVCLGEKYDPLFESDDLVSKMNETKRDYYKIDLILEDSFGYSTIWIDR